MSSKKLAFILVFLLPLFLFSQTSEKTELDSLKKRVEKIEKWKKYLPVISGIVKAKLEYNFQTERMRFTVRNARFGARGMINKHFGYRVEVDLCDEGRIRMLDAYALFRLPMPEKHQFDIYLGQLKVPFSTDHLRSPADLFFANRSFTTKYINSGLRDIGLSLSYKFENEILPVEVWGALLNGSGANNPQWIAKPNVAFRAVVGPWKGFRIAGNYYNGILNTVDKISMWGAELRYSYKDFMIETEYINRMNTDTMNILHPSDGMYIQAVYKFRINSKVVHYILPALRYDMMGGKVFKGYFDPARITVGVNTGFDSKIACAEIRLNYEKYFYKKDTPNLEDKITLEFLVRF